MLDGAWRPVLGVSLSRCQFNVEDGMVMIPQLASNYD
jgi:hypothetical protein